MPVLTPLADGQPVVIGAPVDSTGYAYIDVPSGVPILQVTLHEGSGDPDLFVADPDGHFESSQRDGSNETLSFPNPKPGRWRVEVDGFKTYAGVFLTASLITPTPLSPNTALTNLSGAVGSETFYRVTVPPGLSSFEVTLGGVFLSQDTQGQFSGNVELYLKFGSPTVCQSSLSVSTKCTYDYSSPSFGFRSIIVSNPAAGDWYLDLSGAEEFARVSLTTSTVVAPPKPDLAISMTHAGTLIPGQTAIYTTSVTNVGPAATLGQVAVAYSLPTGLSYGTLNAFGWSCVNQGNVVCMRSDALAPSDSYPPLMLTVHVAANPPSSLTTTATVSGGGETNAANDTATDVAVLTGPAITRVINAFGGSTIIAPNTWVAIQGTGLAPANDSRAWDTPDFVNNLMPTHLDGVSATVNGKSAYLSYISPTQINLITPPDALSGSIVVQVTNNGVVSNIFTVPGQAQSLSFCEFVTAGGKQYVCGRHVNGNGYIGPTSLFPGLTTPVKPNEDIYLVATGFGLTDVPVVSGSVTQTGNLPLPFPEIEIGGKVAKVVFAGSVFPATYQFNLTVPGDVPDGDLPLTATYNGLTTQLNLLITVQH